MTEIELQLCEAAAKAAGVKVERTPSVFYMKPKGSIGPAAIITSLRVVDDDHGICGSDANFNPLEGDAQAFRLAMHLGIEILPDLAADEVTTAYCVVEPRGLVGYNESEDVGDDLMRAARLVVTKTAAKMAHPNEPEAKEQP